MAKLEGVGACSMPMHVVRYPWPDAQAGDVGKADDISLLWRAKQLEYTAGSLVGMEFHVTGIAPIMH
jgi:hypothetical protein